MRTDNVLHTAYRPDHFEDVIGQDSTIKGLRALIRKDGSHAFLFSGPSGTGKTTLARIVAKECGCKRSDIIEFDAASKTGIDDIRELIDVAQYRPFGGGDARAFIIDEAHSLSKQAWQALLKLTEEPPKFIYFFLCTTELGRVPKTIQTRFSSFPLKLVPDKPIRNLVEWVSREEGLKLDDAVVDLIVKEAYGSPRQALNNLAKCSEVKSKREAQDILQTARDSDAVLDLCQFIVSGGSWMKAMGIMEKIDPTKEDEEDNRGSINPESVRIVVCNYLAAVIRKTKEDDRAGALLMKLDAFSVPYNQSEGYAPLYLSIGRVLYPE